MVNTLLTRSTTEETTNNEPLDAAQPASTAAASIGDALTPASEAATRDGAAWDGAALPDAGPLMPISHPQRPVRDRGTRVGRDTTIDRAPVSARIITTPHRHDRVGVQVCGRLDRVGIARLRGRLAQARAAGTPEVVLDLSAMTWSDHSLARALAWARVQLRGNNQHLTLTGSTAQLRAEITAEETRLGCPLWQGPRPGDPRYRPETADQP